MELTTDTVALIGAMLSFAGVLVLGFLQFRLWRAQAGASDATAAKTISDAATSLVDPLQEQLSEMRCLNGEMKKEIIKLKGIIKQVQKICEDI